MDEERKADGTGGALFERASELCEQVYGRCTVYGIADPNPRDFVRELLLLNQARVQNTGHGFGRDVLSQAAWFLIPPFDR